MNILFLIYHGFSEHSGISKKILYQIKGFRELSHNVYVCQYTFDNNGHRVRMIDNTILQDFGKGKFAALKHKYSYDAISDFTKRNNIQFVYARSFHNANPFTIRLFKQFKIQGIKSVIEIPTYPYDQEYIGFPFITRMGIKIDKLYRKRLAALTDCIVTFTDDNFIFGQKTCRISNGIDFESIPLKKELVQNLNKINFIGVAEIHYWHGFDRFIQGIGEYYVHGGEKDIYFHIVGGIGQSEMYNSKHAVGFKELINKYNIKDRIIFHGQQFGDSLDHIFDQCDFAVGSLARHRCGIYNIKTLKNREYAARGVPFIYSENDKDFDNMPYVFKVPANESEIDIRTVINFYKNLTASSSDIRNTIGDLSWKYQMQRVLVDIFNKKTTKKDENSICSRWTFITKRNESGVKSKDKLFGRKHGL